MHVIGLAAVALLAAAAYWWYTRPPGRYKPDNGGLYPINVDGKYGFIDRTGKIAIRPQFDEAWEFSEGRAHVRIGSRHGYIDRRGKVVITPQFDDASRFQYGRAAVRIGDVCAFIDKSGKLVSSPTLKLCGMFSGALARVGTANGLYSFIDRSGKIKLSLEGVVGDMAQQFSEGLIAAASNRKWGYLNTSGKWAIEPQFEMAYSFSEGLAAVKVGGRWGYINRKGNFAINPQYDSAGEFSEGLAAYAENKRFGFIDRQGRIVVPPKYVRVGDFSEGLAPVLTEQARCGFINRNGQMVIPAEFDDAAPFQNGFARVIALGTQAYVNTAGAFLYSPFAGRTVIAERERLAAQARPTQQDEGPISEQHLVGEWIGHFYGTPGARLTIIWSGGSLKAQVISAGLRLAFDCHLLPEGRLLLTGTAAHEIIAQSHPTYSLDRCDMTLSESRLAIKGRCRDDQGHTGQALFTREGTQAD